MEGPNRDEQLHNTSQDIIKRLKELEASNKWTENGTKPCKKFKTQIGERIASKGEDICEYNIEKVFQFLEKEETLAKINPMLLEIKVLYVKQNDFRVNYMQYKGIWPVSNRDFVNVSVHLKESDSKIYIGTKACNFPHPEVKGVVRGEVFIGGYIMDKIDETHTKVTYISDADLKGSIPNLIKNTLSEKQAQIASKVGYVMKKEGY